MGKDIVERQPSDGAVVAQIEAVGKPFNRGVDCGECKNGRGRYSEQRRNRIVAGFDENTGDTFTATLGHAGQVVPSQLPHTELNNFRNEYDPALNGHLSLGTVLSHGASTQGVDQDAIDRSRGGNPDYRIDHSGGNGLKDTGYRQEKSGGFRSSQEARRVAESES